MTIAGLDPARFGDDRTALVIRQGRKVIHTQTWKGKDTMEVVGLLCAARQEWKIDMAFIDVGGLGAGVVDRLRELGHRDWTRPVNSGEKASGNAFVKGAKVLLANGGLSEAWAAYEAHDYSHLVDIGIEQGAKIIAAVDPGLAPIAPLAASIIIYARHHPANTLSLAMKAADGMGGEDYGTRHVTI